MSETVTVIIPTTCEKRREAQLLRAIDSIQRQKGVSANILVVVNGKRFDSDLLAALKSREDLTVEYLELGSAPNACAHARSIIQTRYFSFLDDDDELLDDSLRVRLDAFDADPSLDLVVANGYNEIGGKREIRVKNGERVNEDIQMALIEANWLTSCGGVFRTDSITEAFFKEPAEYNEWTLLAFRITCTRKVLFINKPTFVVHSTPGSLSKSKAFVLSDADVIRSMIELTDRKEVRLALNRKLCGSLHYIADYLLEQGNYFDAWKYHIKSLLYPGGFAYLSFTRKLLAPWIFK